MCVLFRDLARQEPLLSSLRKTMRVRALCLISACELTVFELTRSLTSGREH